MAEEKAENGEGAEENDENVGDEGEEAGVSKGAVVIYQRAANESNHGFPKLCGAVNGAIRHF